MSMILSWFSSVFLAQVLPSVVIIVIGILAIRLLMKIVTKALERSKLEKAAYSLIKSVLRVVLYVILSLIVASSLGIDVTSIVALASVLSLAVSLAVQDALTNLIGGFTLLYTKPFHSGDFVEIAGQSGTVKEIGLTYTKLATPDNKLVAIPNSAVTSAQIVNYTTTGTRRMEIKVSASYDAPTPKVLEALREAANVPGALEEPALFVGVEAYGDSAIEYVLRLWATTEDYWDVYYQTNQRIRETFAASGIEMTYPHLNVHLDK